MKCTLILALTLLACDSPEAAAKRAREAERRARTDCAHVVVRGECFSVVGICADGGLAPATACSDDRVVVVCPEDLPPPRSERE